MKNIKYFIGPMSKNIVDACVSFCNDTGNNIAFIPSRRQVEYDGGYVNNWTTEQFANYSKSENIFLCRDHAGPNQGLKSDDGYRSLEEDCKYLDLIHIDPWKKTNDLEAGIDLTAEMISFCHSLNSQIKFEVGTEQSIREFTPSELDKMLHMLKKKLTSQQFEKIVFCVIQSGTALERNINTGVYDASRLRDMISVVKTHGLASKEHNGDYLSPALIQEKFNLGLDTINIAPEFGQIETKIYLDKICSHRIDLLEEYWSICYRSKRWEKWVTADFKPVEQKEELINICGHYVLSTDEFMKNIKQHLPDIDKEIKQAVHRKLESLEW